MHVKNNINLNAGYKLRDPEKFICSSSILG